MTRFREAAWIVLLVVLVGCSGDHEHQGQRPADIGDPAAAGSRTVVSGRCDNERGVARDHAYHLPGSLTGDADGDGEDDAISLHLDRQAETGCQAFLVVETGEATFSSPVWERGRELGLPRPSLGSLVQVDGRGGFEITVMEAAGASSQFVGLFRVAEGRLERVVPRGTEVAETFPQPEGLFAHGGSVGHIEAVDCGDDQTLWVSSAVPSAQPGDLERGLYEVTRQTFGFDARGALRARGVVRQRIPLQKLERRFPEFARAPFGSCATSTRQGG